MKLLIDTQIALWLISGLPYLKHETVSLLADPDNDLFLSIAAPWEITIKSARGKIAVHGRELVKLARQNTIDILPISLEHILHLQELPLIHHDPFDRIMIAQAICDDMLFISADRDIYKYTLSDAVSGLRLEPVVRQAVQY
jgi:PIN domain nuclease of toxin-antitoxin system